MGQELECKMRDGKRAQTGTAQLESDYLMFRGTDRLKILFNEMTKVEAAEGILHIEHARGEVDFELGEAAERWANKILHPPTRLDKLGVKSGTSVRVDPEFDPAFLAELTAAGAAINAKGPADLVFLGAQRLSDLRILPTVAKLAKQSGALWVVYPKGLREIREIDVIERGRKAGLKDVKVAAFSPTQTALKFVVPLVKRAKGGK